MGYQHTPQLFALAPISGGDPSSTSASQLMALAAFSDVYIANYMKAPQLFALAVYDGDITVDTLPVMASQLFALGIYGTGSPEDLRIRAWSFIMDGHKMYALSCGELGTYIYDSSTAQWYKWQTAGYTRWNAVLGLSWDGRVLAGDVQNNIIWELSPENWNDEGFKDITHIVTAILPATMREWHTLDAIYLNLSSGYLDSLNPTILLEYSDDKGNTWDSPEDGLITLTEDDFSEEVAWLSLGAFTAPGRIIRITDSGGPIVIETANMRLDGEE